VSLLGHVRRSIFQKKIQTNFHAYLANFHAYMVVKLRFSKKRIRRPLLGLMLQNTTIYFCAIYNYIWRICVIEKRYSFLKKITAHYNPTYSKLLIKPLNEFFTNFVRGRCGILKKTLSKK